MRPVIVRITHVVVVVSSSSSSSSLSQSWSLIHYYRHSALAAHTADDVAPTLIHLLVTLVICGQTTGQIDMPLVGLGWSSGHFEGNAVVKMSSALKFHFCRLLCAKNTVIAPSNVSNSQKLYPSNPLCGSTRYTPPRPSAMRVLRFTPSVRAPAFPLFLFYETATE